MFPGCSCIHSCVHLETLLARYLENLLTEFDQTFTTDGIWGKNERFKFWGQKVKGQGHSGVKHVGGGIIIDRVVRTI